MKTLDQFKTENAVWLEDVISDYAAEGEVINRLRGVNCGKTN